MSKAKFLKKQIHVINIGVKYLPHPVFSLAAQRIAYIYATLDIFLKPAGVT